MTIDVAPVGRMVRVGDTVGRTMGSSKHGRLLDCAKPGERSRLIMVPAGTDCTLEETPMTRSRASCWHADHLEA